MTEVKYNLFKDPKDLKPHKINLDIYGDEIADVDLVESIREKGILEPIVILEDNTIISGHRRWFASMSLNLERVPCRSMSFSSELDENEALVEFNRQRSKTYSQRMNEAELLTSVYSERARLRQIELAGTRPNKDVDLVPTSAPGEEEKTDAEDIAIPENNQIKEVGKTRDIVAEKVGLKRDKYTKIKKVWDVAKTGHTYAKSLVEKLDKEDVSANEAAKRIKVYEEAPEPIKKKIIEEDLTAKEAVKVIEEIKNPHVSFNAGDNEWYTPKEYIDACLSLMGSIDLDPASSAEANKIVNATEFFTEEQNGLEKDWYGNVWLNPPYASKLIGQFIDKMCSEFENGNVDQACVLVNNATETKWFQKIGEVSTAILFPAGRIKFWHPNKESMPLQGQALLYLGDNKEEFEDIFSKFGLVYNVI